MSRIEELAEVKRKVERLRRDKQRAKGRLDSAMTNLKEYHGLSSLKAAQKKLDELEIEERNLAAAFDKAKEEFDREWDSLQEALKEST